MTHTLRRKRFAAAAGVTAAATAAIATGLTGGSATATAQHAPRTPIRHLVVIFQENVSFDHYFGTYPHAANTSGQHFTPRPRTPSINGLTGPLRRANPNGLNPHRYDPSNVADVITCDQGHAYTDEQLAFDGGKMDRFPQTVGNDTGTSPVTGKPCVAGDVMNYYDGNTVSALWHYAQRYAMNDNSYGTTFGPSSPGAINLAAGDTGGVDMGHTSGDPSVATADDPDADLVSDGRGGFTMIADAQPYWDDCTTRDAIAFEGRNIGDQLNDAGLSWGFFQGGFRPTTSFADAAAATGHPGQKTSEFIPDEFRDSAFYQQIPNATNEGICNAVHAVGASLPAPLPRGTGQYGYKNDYIPHHQPFQYYASTANPHHLTLPRNAHGRISLTALRTIGRDTQHYVGGAPQFDTPNHQYGISDFNQLVRAIRRGRLPASALPAVSILKAPGYQDGHAAYSDPLDEQRFVVREINALQRTPAWRSTAVIVAYDDSDGWYDHAYAGVVNPSSSVSDALTDPGMCGVGHRLSGEQGRCGYGPRLPFLVISPWARHNAVDHSLTDQSSIIRFVEDNWGLPRIPGSADRLAGDIDRAFDFEAGRPLNARRFILDPATGQPAGAG